MDWNRNSYLKSLVSPKKAGLFQKAVRKDLPPHGTFPLTNEVNPVFPVYMGRKPEVDYGTLWAYFKASPEMQAILTAIVDDVISDGWAIEGGRNQVLKAEEFLLDNHAKQVFTSVLFDVLLTGDGYIWKDKINAKAFSANLSKILSKNGFENKSSIISKATEEDLFSTRKIIDVPSSTMTININKYGDVQEYIQKPENSMNIVKFGIDQIIHFRLMKLNGKVYGYSPSQSLLTIMDVLDDIRDYARYYFRKGGVPNYMFILKDANTSDADYKALHKAINQYSNLTHRYKNMVLTGDVEIKEMNKLDHDMEFKELARYLTQIMVMVWSIPSSRLSDMLITAGMKGSGTSTEGYFRKIGHIQDIFEEMINSQLLDEFKVKLKFNRTYKQDEVREGQIQMMFADAVMKKQELLKSYDKRIKVERLLKELKLKDEDIEDHEFEDEELMMAGNRQGLVKTNKLTSDPEKQEDDKNKSISNTDAKSWEAFKKSRGII